jgi:hypothetical protein
MKVKAGMPIALTSRVMHRRLTQTQFFTHAAAKCCQMQISLEDFLYTENTQRGGIHEVLLREKIGVLFTFIEDMRMPEV